MFKAKPYKKVGRGEWQVIVPRPPKHATHVRMMAFDPTTHNFNPKLVTLTIEDFGAFKGVCGDFHYIRMDKKGKIHEEYKDSWYWDGQKVKGIEKLLEE
jgi:hypothetical protein